MAYSSDNASVIKGKHNSVLSRIRSEQPNVFDLCCICHLANLAVGVGIKKLPLAVEDLLVDVYFNFHKSAKRSEIYIEFLEFTMVESVKILKYCSTRWLSLLTCIQRMLSQWPSLQSYFASHEDVEKRGRVKECHAKLENLKMKCFYYFLSFTLRLLADFNVAFQA